MRDTIETAPKDGEVVILEDDASGTYDIARWSPEAGGWVVGENAEPINITPSHWYPLRGDNHLHQGDGLSSSVSEASTSASRFHSFLLRRAATQWPTASEAIAPRSRAEAKAQTGPAKAKRALHARRRFTTSSIAATLVAAALIGVYFRSEVVASVTRYADLQDISRIGTIGGQLVGQATELLSQGPAKAYLRALQGQVEADQVSVAEATAAELRQSLQQERDRTAALANELATVRRDFETQVALSSKTGDEPSMKEDVPTAGCMPIGLTASGEIVFPIQCKEERQRGQAVEQKPAAVEARPGVSLPAWANSDAFVKPRGRAMSPDDGYSCQHYRTYDPASRTYMGYDGRRHSCP